MTMEQLILSNQAVNSAKIEEHNTVVLSGFHTVTQEQFERISAERKKATAVLTELNFPQWAIATATKSNGTKQEYRATEAITIVSGSTTEYKNIIRFDCFFTNFADYLNTKLDELKGAITE